MSIYKYLLFKLILNKMDPLQFDNFSFSSFSNSQYMCCFFISMILSFFCSQNALHIDVSQCPQRGDLLLVIGSPFGILSPLHFFNRCCFLYASIFQIFIPLPSGQVDLFYQPCIILKLIEHQIFLFFWGKIC